MKYGWSFIFLLFLSCSSGLGSKDPVIVDCAPAKPFVDSMHVQTPAPPIKDSGAGSTVITTGNTRPEQLVGFATTLIGTPYVYGSSDPLKGFDCSGFINYIFNHFNISVPRSSIDFTHVGTTVPVEQAKTGDLILFTGTDPMETNIGHMGLVISNDTSGLQFIHATSGKAMAVAITPLNDQYKKRFVRISRIFH